MENWGWWMIGIAVFIWAMDLHKRVSQIGDRLAGYERRIEELTAAIYRLEGR